MIRGLGWFWQAYHDDEIEHQALFDELAAVGPMFIIGKARDIATSPGRLRGTSISREIAKEIVHIYNRPRKVSKLAVRMVS